LKEPYNIGFDLKKNNEILIYPRSVSLLKVIFIFFFEKLGTLHFGEGFFSLKFGATFLI